MCKVVKDTLIIDYKHHGVKVCVMSHLKGRHREHCLCFAECKHFKPNAPDNCEIAQMNYDNCVKFGVTLPVWECSKYDPHT